MSPKQLHFDSLIKAINSLQRAVNRYLQEPDDKEVRDSVIQRFEYSYELCWKMTRRVLELRVAIPAEIAHLDYKNLMREAAKQGLISEPEAWFTYRHYRNLTSHSYDEEVAERVAIIAADFLADAQQLIENLQQNAAFDE